MKKIVIGGMAALALGTGAGLVAVANQAGANPTPNLATDNTAFTQPDSYAFRTVDDKADPTFNQLLGINNSGTIAGYFGSGAQGHPNKGYRTDAQAHAFQNENFPKSVQTQVTGLNDRGVTVGFFAQENTANQVNDNTGFTFTHGQFHRVAFPATSNANPPVNQLLGVNNDNTAVGFYTDAAGNNHGYTYTIDGNRYRAVAIPGSTSSTAAAINNHGDIAGFFTNAGGVTDGYLLPAHGKLTVLAVPGAAMTQALGVNDRGEVVGQYQVGTGNSAQTHGFTWTARGKFKTVDDPSGVGTTTVNGVNNAGTLVGFYADSAGNTHGMLATGQRSRPVTREYSLSSMPAGSVVLGHDRQGMLTAQLNVFGLTPGSAHPVEIDAPGRPDPVVRLGELTADGTGAAHATLTATDSFNALPYGSRLVIRLGMPTSDTTSKQLAHEPIAQSGPLSTHPDRDAQRTELTAVDVNPNGMNVGQLSGHAKVTFDPAAGTLTVTVTASGLTPGNHAAHIHLGTCQQQGGVKYMLMDLTANAHGDIEHESRTVTGVTALPPAGTWYLNIHQGDSNSILSNGQPALGFRPLLCTNL